MIPGQGEPNEITIDLPGPARAVRITLVDVDGVQAFGYDAAGVSYGP